MVSNQNRRINMTKQLFKDSFIDLMQYRTFYQITIKDICMHAGLNRSTFYLHYKHMDSLLHDIEQDALDQTKEYIQIIRSESDKVKYIKLLLDYIKKRPALFRVLICTRNDGDYQRRFIDHLGEIIKNAPASGSENDEVAYARGFIAEGSLSVVQRWIENDFDIPSEKMAELILALCYGASENLRSIT